VWNATEAHTSRTWGATNSFRVERFGKHTVAIDRSPRIAGGLQQQGASPRAAAGPCAR
jgi:hypothetical protein